ncbi:hypothetical protein ASC77_00250 [Nocardioides sp. Root1257]|uniref:hypothetical protein n=1 Tax=unclassified Nocardioides TaxID=2615069 RepID=UPI000700DAC5|nr:MULTISPECIES: hypothetical protein [unclassified Nocardioides]KQW52790.1 hypothetical protein ASC77_00250 [Nocardioides sp. Root1257]KRC55478.1 hypothetical protein ASE24_00250 [Nocardioides sp. Root224]
MAAHTEESRYGELDHAYVARLRTLPAADDSPFLMLNLMRYRDLADYPAGHPDAGAGLSGREADDRYAPLDILHELGARIVLFGDCVPGSHWDRVAVVRYPSVRSFVDMQERPDFIERHVHKDAGMLETIIAVCRPVGGSTDGAGRIAVELLGPDAAVPEPGAGRLVLQVDGTPVGDGRAWAFAVVTAVPPAPATPDAVVVDALIQELP